MSLGPGWPSLDVRAEMLEEAVEVIRELWTGELTAIAAATTPSRTPASYPLPESCRPLPRWRRERRHADRPRRIGDGLIGTGPDAELRRGVPTRPAATDRGIGQVTLCWADSRARRETDRSRVVADRRDPRARRRQELPQPGHFEALTSSVTEDQVAESVSCGPDPEPHVASIRAYIDAGFDQVYMHQVGPDQAGFLEFARRELLPALERQPVKTR